jgi:hypothetical protein
VAEPLLDVFPGADGSAELYEDDGRSLRYTKKRGWARTRFELGCRGKKLVIRGHPTQGTPQGRERHITVRVVMDQKPGRVRLNGRPPAKGMGQYDPQTRRYTIALPATPVKKGFVLTLIP